MEKMIFLPGVMLRSNPLNISRPSRVGYLNTTSLKSIAPLMASDCKVIPPVGLMLKLSPYMSAKIYE